MGIDCAGLEEARRAGLEGLKDLARDALKDSDGQLLFIEVRDESGEKLLKLCICLQVTAMGQASKATAQFGTGHLLRVCGLETIAPNRSSSQSADLPDPIPPSALPRRGGQWATLGEPAGRKHPALPQAALVDMVNVQLARARRCCLRLLVDEAYRWTCRSFRSTACGLL